MKTTENKRNALLLREKKKREYVALKKKIFLLFAFKEILDWLELNVRFEFFFVFLLMEVEKEKRSVSQDQKPKKKKGGLKTIIQTHKLWSKKKKGTNRRNKRQLYYKEKKWKRFIDGNEAQYVDMHTHTQKKN